MKKIAFTTRIPHHSSHSGYEQLIKYLHVDEVVEVERKNAQLFPWNWIERFFRRISVSKWYAWDGLMFEWAAFKHAWKVPTSAFFLYGDTSIGWLPYVKKWLNIKIVATIHSCPDDLEEVFHRPKLLNKVDEFIVLGRNQIPFLLKHGIPEERIHFIPHGVDTDWFKPAAKKDESEIIRVLMVGSWRRNFALYQDVIQRSIDDDSISFTIISHEHNQSYFKDFPQEKVNFKFGISDEELLTHYQTFDVMLLGLEDAVANNVLLEALACGLPVVVENVGAISDYVVESQQVRFFEKNDMEQALELIRNFDPSVFNSKEGRSKSFDWNNIAPKVQDLL